jgi:hypothetical protein
VDVNREIRLGNVTSGAGVGVRGNYSPLTWARSHPLQDPDGDGVFEGSVDFLLDPGTTLEYRFAYETAAGQRVVETIEDPRTHAFTGDATVAVSVWNDVTGVDREEGDQRPDVVRLEQNFPNPFNPVTVVRFSLPTSGRVRLAVYDVTGALVQIGLDEFRTAGIHEVIIEAHDLASGVYYYRLESGESARTRKMIVLK